MKLKDRCRDISIGCPIDVDHIRGHVRIELKDEKTGKVEIHEEHNMMTYALKEYFKNCGFMNRPTVQESNNMVEDLLGGVLGLDTELTQTSDMIHVPAGVKMTFNGSVLNSADAGANTEMGTYKSTESGWNEDHTEWTQQYEFGTNQGNGTIACVCLTGKNHGFVGEGNATSLVRNASSMSDSSLIGTLTEYSGVTGWVFDIDLSDSSCKTFAIEGESGHEVGVLRKYRLPISKVNIMVTQTAPVLLSEDNVTLDGIIETCTLMTQPHNGNLMLWNVNFNTTPTWGEGGWTQYVWTLTRSGTLTRTTVYNTTGTELFGLQMAYFEGDYIVFTKTSSEQVTYQSQRATLCLDTTKIYALNRTTGNIKVINNTFGVANTSTAYLSADWRYPNMYGWMLKSNSGDGRLTIGGNGYNIFSADQQDIIIDIEDGSVAPTNAASGGYLTYPVSGLIRSNGINLYRDQRYIATIFNLDSAVTKTADKSMVVRYTVSFVQEEEP